MAETKGNALIELEHAAPIWVVHFRSGENRFNEAFVGELNDALDTVESSGLPTAV